MFKKNKNSFKRKKDPFLDMPKLVFNEKQKRNIMSPQLFKDKIDKNRLSSLMKNNIFKEDEYFNISFSGVKAVKTIFTFCDLRGCDFSDTTLINCDFSFTDLRNCNFSNAIMRECNFRHARFKNTNMHGVDDFLCDFSGAILF